MSYEEQKDRENENVDRMATREFLRALTALVEKTDQLQRHQNPVRAEFEFGGREGEDPEQYLQKVRRFFAESRISSDARMRTVRTTLVGEARKWLQRQPQNITYEAFEQKFDEEYNGVAVLCELTRKLYGDVHTQAELVQAFVSAKVALFERLHRRGVHPRKCAPRDEDASGRRPMRGMHLGSTLASGAGGSPGLRPENGVFRNRPP